MSPRQRDSICETLNEGRRKNLLHAEALQRIQYAFEAFMSEATAHKDLLLALEAAFPKPK